MTWAQEYVGLPFASRGRDRRGLDCWGLARLVYAEQRGVTLPSWAADYLDAADRAHVARLMVGGRSDWAEIPAGEEQPFDLVLLRIGAHACHVGVVTARGWFLHVTKGVDVTHERYDGPLWVRRVVGFWRWSPA